MLEFLNPFHSYFVTYIILTLYIIPEFSTLSFDDVTVDDVTIARDMFTKSMATEIVFQRLKISSSISTRVVREVCRILL